MTRESVIDYRLPLPVACRYASLGNWSTRCTSKTVLRGLLRQSSRRTYHCVDGLVLLSYAIAIHLVLGIYVHGPNIIAKESGVIGQVEPPLQIEAYGSRVRLAVGCNSQLCKRCGRYEGHTGIAVTIGRRGRRLPP